MDGSIYFWLSNNEKVYSNENQSEKKLESLFMYSVLGIMIGARLGHVIFYQTELLERIFLVYFFLLNLVAELNLLDLEGWRVMEPQLE